MAYPGPQNDLDADDDNFETANQNQGQGIYHVPFHHHQPQLNDQQVQLVQLPRHDGSDGGARRAPSFQERIQKADSNHNVKATYIFVFQIYMLTIFYFSHLLTERTICGATQIPVQKW